MKHTKEKKVRAWAIFDQESQTLLRYDKNGEYAICPERTPSTHLHHTFKAVPCTITYSLPQRRSERKV